MLFHSSIRAELARSFGATLIVLVTVVMTMMLIRTLGQASRGGFDPSDVMMVMGYTVLGHLPTILTMSLFISIVSTLSRMFRDSEMVIWFTSGRGLSSLLAPLFRFAWPILLAVLVLALLIWPWSNRQIQDMKDHFEMRGDVERVEPGQFQESASGDRVFFVEKDTVGRESGKNVFIATAQHGKQTLTSARSGRIQFSNESRFLMLSNGQRLEQGADGANLKLSEFEEYGIKVDSADFTARDTVPAKSRSTADLLREPTRANLGEFSWRLGLALAALNLVLMGVAVSNVNPRIGRSTNYVFSLFAFVVYYNLINLGQNWIASEQVGALEYMLGLHGGALAVGALWVTKRHNNWSLRLRAPAGAAAAAQEAR